MSWTYQKTAYQQKLDDPRWQKKRLEVFERAGWKCEECGGNSTQLHAHHKYYVAKRDPWEYQIQAFSCLCAACHKSETETHDEIKNFESIMVWLSDEELGDLDAMMMDFFYAHRNTNSAESAQKFLCVVKDALQKSAAEFMEGKSA